MTDPDAPLATETVVVTPPRARRRRPLKVVAVLLLVLGVLVVGFVVLDGWARQQVADYVADKARSVLSLDADEPVAVEVGGTSVIAQVVTGSLDRVEVGVTQVTIGELTGDVRLVAEGVPVDVSKPVDRVQIQLRVAEDDIQAIAHTLSATTIDSVRLVKGEIQFGSEITVFGIPFTVGIGVEPFADGGSIGFTPTSVEIAGTRSSAESLIKQFGRPAEQLLKTQSICVAQWLPAALGVETVEVGTKRLTVTIGATKALFDEKSLAALGSCE